MHQTPSIGLELRHIQNILLNPGMRACSLSKNMMDFYLPTKGCLGINTAHSTHTYRNSPADPPAPRPKCARKQISYPKAKESKENLVRGKQKFFQPDSEPDKARYSRRWNLVQGKIEESFSLFRQCLVKSSFNAVFACLLPDMEKAEPPSYTTHPIAKTVTRLFALAGLRSSVNALATTTLGLYLGEALILRLTWCGCGLI